MDYRIPGWLGVAALFAAIWTPWSARMTATAFLLGGIAAYLEHRQKNTPPSKTTFTPNPRRNRLAACHCGANHHAGDSPQDR